MNYRKMDVGEISWIFGTYLQLSTTICGEYEGKNYNLIPYLSKNFNFLLKEHINLNTAHLDLLVANIYINMFIHDYLKGFRSN